MVTKVLDTSTAPVPVSCIGEILLSPIHKLGLIEETLIGGSVQQPGSNEVTLHKPNQQVIVNRKTKDEREDAPNKHNTNTTRLSYSHVEIGLLFVLLVTRVAATEPIRLDNRIKLNWNFTIPDVDAMPVVQFKDLTGSCFNELHIDGVKYEQVLNISGGKAWLSLIINDVQVDDYGVYRSFMNNKPEEYKDIKIPESRCEHEQHVIGRLTENVPVRWDIPDKVVRAKISRTSPSKANIEEFGKLVNGNFIRNHKFNNGCGFETKLQNGGRTISLVLHNTTSYDYGFFYIMDFVLKDRHMCRSILLIHDREIEATAMVGVSGTVRSTSIRVGDFNPSEPVIDATTLVDVFGTDRASSTLVGDFNPSAPGSDSIRLELMVIAVIGFLIASFIFFAVVSIYFCKRKLNHGKRVTNTAMAGHSYESINSSFYDRRGSSVIHDVDTSRVALAGQSILNSGAGVTNGSLSSNFNLADEEIILSPEDNDHTSAMNDISTVMTIMNQSTSVRQLQPNNNISITVDHPPIHQSGNTIHEEYLSSCSNSYERLQRRSENADNRPYTSLKDDMTYKTQ